MRRIVLLLSQQFLVVALLELGVGGAAVLGELHELLGNLHAAHVVAANLGDHLARLVFELLP